jgi:hypothetical protein
MILWSSFLRIQLSRGGITSLPRASRRIDKPSYDALLMAEVLPGMRLWTACSGDAGNVVAESHDWSDRI